MTDKSFPIGELRVGGDLTPAARAGVIEQIAQVPTRLRTALSGLTEAQLDTPYRAGGWTVRQVVHHLADAHMNAYVRFRLGLTEDDPTIKPWRQERWAELPDARSLPPETSLRLLESVHRRWVDLLRAMTPADFARGVAHPEWGRRLTLDELLEACAWHGRHHVAQLTALRDRLGW